jgi:hypothetical protein
MNATKFLVEFAVDVISKKIQDDISTALLDTETLHSAGLTATQPINLSCEPPRSYFIYETPLTFRAPAVFLIADSIDFRKERGANFIDAALKLYCSVVIEDKDADRLTRKAWRYQAALNQVLDQSILTIPGYQFKMVVKVTDAAFSPIASLPTDPNDRSAVFRKEVSLTLTVENYESLY